MTQGNTTPQTYANPDIDVFWYYGTTDLKDGQGLCFDNTYATTSTGQTAADPFGGRSRAVALPTTTNCQAFAGWVVGDITAQTGGRQVRVQRAVPDNTVEARVDIATTVNSTYVTASVGTDIAGVALADGRIPGKGRLLALQTVAVKASRTDGTAGPVYNALDATGSITTAGVLTDTAAFTYATEGDRVVIVGAASAAGAAITDGSGGSVLGEYVIGTWTSANQVTLTGYVGDATAIISYVVVRGYPKVLCRCDQDSRESGLVEFIQPIASTAVNPTALVGTTKVCGGTLTAADSTATLADGTLHGQRKIIEEIAALVTNNYVVTVTTGFSFTGLTRTAVATATFDGVSDRISFEWETDGWRLKDFVLDAIA